MNRRRGGIKEWASRGHKLSRAAAVREQRQWGDERVQRDEMRLEKREEGEKEKRRRSYWRKCTYRKNEQRREERRGVEEKELHWSIGIQPWMSMLQCNPMVDAQKHMQIDRRKKRGEESIHKYDKRSRGIYWQVLVLDQKVRNWTCSII